METLDYGLKKIDEGEKVYLLECDGSISYCAANPLNMKSVCKSCIAVQKMYQRELPKIKWLTFNTKNDNVLNFSEEQISNTIASIYNTAPYECKNTREKLKSDYSLVNSLISDTIQDHNIDTLILWNGRRVSEGDGAYHERSQSVTVQSIISAGGSLQGYDTYLVLDAPKIHNMNARKKHILDFKKSTYNTQLANLSKQYFDFASGKQSYASTGLATFQNKFQEPPSAYSNQYDYTIANGTFVEFYGHEGWELDFGESFNDIIRIIIHEILSIKKDAKILVRFHPNIRKLSRIEHKKIEDLKKAFASVDFIMPSSNISTHDILARSKVVFSVGSSVGIEAAKLGVETVYFVGRNYFEDINAFEHVRSLTELRNAIISTKATDKSDVDLFGAYIGHRAVEQIRAAKVLPKQTIIMPSGAIIKTPIVAKICLRLWSYGLRFLGPKFIKLIRCS